MKRRSDAGFTLIEMLISMGIVSIIGGVLFTVLFTGLRTTDDTRVRLGESSDAQLIASYLVPDLQSVDPASASKDPSSEACGTAADDGENRLQLSWSDDAGGGSFIASYRFLTTGKLVRLLCDGGGTVLRRTVLADELDSADVPGAVSGPRITMVLVENNTFSYEVTATRRSEGTRGGGAEGGADGSTDGSTDGGTDTEPPECTGTMTITPGSVKLQGNHLKDPVVIRAVVSATCETLHLHFDTGADGVQIPTIPILDESDPTVRELVIEKTAYKWSKGEHPISLHRQDHDTDIDSGSLAVT